ncbi:DMT family transporter [Hellea balneolensis]|uniref:DMT family transporter n=1 Tax=Hellea balneolensis TaxID=287478 RepID=UPI0022772906|nr:DMT family transporter [Hellea balneolensis]
MLCCLCWAGNFIVSSWAVGAHPVPPFMLAFIRAAIVMLFMSPFLFMKWPTQWWRLAIVCACVGPIHLAFLYTGLQTAPASGSSIVSQMLIPLATILSVIFLRETIGWVRGLGIIGAFIGTIIMIYEPSALSFDVGLIYILCAYLSLAVGSVMMKTVGNVDWQQYVTWVAVMVFVLMGAASAVFEQDHVAIWQTSKWPLLVAAGYAAVMVSIVAHGQYFKMIAKYDVSIVVPLTLMVPVFACILAVLFRGETIFPRYYIGAALILPCVFIIAKRGKTAPVQED